jgi:predicted O-linked N-acetylglucosamine transferase (SPINDLY family)
VPDSRLLLYPFNPNWDSYSIDAFMTRLAAGLQRHGIEPQRVLVLEAAPQWNDVLRRLSLADIYLDSFPFCGATSLLDPLFCGLPVIGMEGTAHRALQGPGVLRSLGLGELVAADVNAYIRLAIRLAVNHKHCKALATRVKSLMQQQPVILDRRRYAAAVGRAFEQMWQDHCDGRLSNQTHNTADKAQ